MINIWTLAVSALLTGLLFAMPSAAITYIGSGTLALSEDGGLGDSLGLADARLTYEIDASTDSEPTPFTGADQAAGGTIEGRFAVEDIRVHLTGTLGGANDVVFSMGASFAGFLTTVNNQSEADEFRIPAFSSSGTPLVGGASIFFPNLTVFLLTPYSEFTTFGMTTEIARLPIFSLLGISGVESDLPFRVRSSIGNAYSEYSWEELSIGSVPEPSIVVLIGLGLVVISGRRR